uniref:Coatomer gamma subunit appendage Ig-like subdomain domain-containing protein n=1 Tax=Ananas comosus var. bracteatus TaxID=296719 RepID=A0A6V7PPW5_ANACO|nr:unnamed protein product [Ananas comosus var. bracteatus]
MVSLEFSCGGLSTALESVGTSPSRVGLREESTKPLFAGFGEEFGGSLTSGLWRFLIDPAGAFDFGCCCRGSGSRQGRRELEPYLTSRARGALQQYNCTNTIPEQLLENVTVFVDASEAEEFAEVASKPLRSLPYDTSGQTFVAFEKPEGVPATGKFSNILKFIIVTIQPTSNNNFDSADEGSDQPGSNSTTNSVWPDEPNVQTKQELESAKEPNG